MKSVETSKPGEDIAYMSGSRETEIQSLSIQICQVQGITQCKLIGGGGGRERRKVLQLKKINH